MSTVKTIGLRAELAARNPGEAAPGADLGRTSAPRSSGRPAVWTRSCYRTISNGSHHHLCEAQTPPQYPRPPSTLCASPLDDGDVGAAAGVREGATRTPGPRATEPLHAASVAAARSTASSSSHARALRRRSTPFRRRISSTHASHDAARVAGTRARRGAPPCRRGARRACPAKTQRRGGAPSPRRRGARAPRRRARAPAAPQGLRDETELREARIQFFCAPPLRAQGVSPSETVFLTHGSSAPPQRSRRALAHALVTTSTRSPRVRGDARVRLEPLGPVGERRGTAPVSLLVARLRHRSLVAPPPTPKHQVLAESLPPGPPSSSSRARYPRGARPTRARRPSIAAFPLPSSPTKNAARCRAARRATPAAGDNSRGSRGGEYNPTSRSERTPAPGDATSSGRSPRRTARAGTRTRSPRPGSSACRASAPRPREGRCGASRPRSARRTGG